MKRKQKRSKTRATFTIDADVYDKCILLKERSGLNLSQLVEAYLRNVVSIVEGLADAANKAESSSSIESQQLFFLQQTILNAVSGVNEIVKQPSVKKSETPALTDK